MKKILSGIAITAVVVLFFVSFFFNGILKKAIETVGPKITQTEISVDSIKISLFTGKGDIRGLVIGNPEGFESEAAFKLSRVKVVLDPRSIFSDRIVVREILVEAPEITYETSLRKSNIGVLMENIQSFSGSSKKEGPASKQKKRGKKLQIDHFLLSDAKVRVQFSMLEGTGVGVSLSRIELNDIGKGFEGATIGEVSQEVFGEISKEIIATSSKAGKIVSEKAKDVGDTVSSTADDLGDSAKKVGETTKEGVTKAFQGVKGLFNKEE